MNLYLISKIREIIIEDESEGVKTIMTSFMFSGLYRLIFIRLPD